MIVKKMQVGPATVYIDDTYCRDQTPEQRAEIMERVSAIAYDALLNQEIQRRKKEKEENALH